MSSDPSCADRLRQLCEAGASNFGNIIDSHGSQENKPSAICLSGKYFRNDYQAGSEGRSTFMVNGWKMVLLQQILDQHTTREWV